MTGLHPFADWAARSLRAELRSDRPVLFHGTRYARAIIRADRLAVAPCGDRCVSLTRCPRIAAYVALLPREHDEGGGAILVLDRDRLRQRYALDVRHCGFWDGQGHGPSPWMFDEAEEAVWRDIAPLSRVLLRVVPLGAVSVPDVTREVFA